ncbi:hypothetical protein LHA31_09210 [Carnobacterium viridans]|uniref:Uncharacterized protein n=1 Tax=Carnobacterium viridans TaxID=174587 RepID=A0A1H0Z8R4_9LACT|nr:hypothetical protein [Carnobacterium viridans]UDE94749.1 hypothetical protein LHA31_09210 [Carnobacterium viridans]SDQ23839.1 hypothetical protein SAMN04487752_1381 [Carnobacterium viridans]
MTMKMKKTKLIRLKEGFLYALLFIGFNAIKNLIYDYGEMSQLFRELSHAPRNVIGVLTLTILGLWLFIGLLIGGVLIISDVSRR